MGRRAVWAKGMALSMECPVVAEVGRHLGGENPRPATSCQMYLGREEWCLRWTVQCCMDERLSDDCGALSGFLMGGLGFLWNVKGLREGGWGFM